MIELIKSIFKKRSPLLQEISRKQRSEIVKKKVLKICRMDDFKRPFGRNSVFWASSAKYCNGWSSGDLQVCHGIGPSYHDSPKMCMIRKGAVCLYWDSYLKWEIFINEKVYPEVGSSEEVELHQGKWLEYMERELPGIEAAVRDYVELTKRDDEEVYQKHMQEIKDKFADSISK